MNSRVLYCNCWSLHEAGEARTPGSQPGILRRPKLKDPMPQRTSPLAAHLHFTGRTRQMEKQSHRWSGSTSNARCAQGTAAEDPSSMVFSQLAFSAVLELQTSGKLLHLSATWCHSICKTVFAGLLWKLEIIHVKNTTQCFALQMCSVNGGCGRSLSWPNSSQPSGSFAVTYPYEYAQKGAIDTNKYIYT